MDRHPIDLDDVVREAVSQVSDRVTERCVTLELNSVSGLIVNADPDRIGQVLTNVLENARQHTPTGGHVRVDAAVEPGPVRVTARDTGEGISPQHLPRVFDRFFRVDAARDRAHSGSGIGLPIARAIASAHGGTLTAASDGPGRGATFSLTLPFPPHQARGDDAADGSH